MSNELAFTSLLPPLLVLLLGYITRKVMLSLLVGIIVAAFIAADYALVPTILLAGKALWKNIELQKFLSPQQFWQTWNLFICIFLFVLGIFVALLQYSGGVFAYTKFISKFVNNKKNAESSSLALSTTLFIDDYFSCLTVGPVMTPLTDTYKIPRVKLAFLIHAMSSPLAILCPFSSWVAAMIGFLRENGIARDLTADTVIHASPLATYFYILPFIFYSFILTIAVWYIVRADISFGLMKKREQTALATGDLLGDNQPRVSTEVPVNNFNLDNHALRDFFVPVTILIVSVLLSLAYTGDWQLFGGSNGFIIAMQQSKAAMALFLGGMVTLLLTFGYFLLRKSITLSTIPSLSITGIKLMLPAVIILLLAWTLGDLLREHLHTGKFLASFLMGSINPYLLPVLFFLVALLIAFALGSSWGTAAIVFPIAIPMIVSLAHIDAIPTTADLPLLFPLLGATLSGCVAGNHLSPIADTTIMSAASAKCSVLDHINTQLPYALPVVIATALSFLLPSWLMQFGVLTACVVPIVLGAALSIIILQGLQVLSNRKK